MSDIHSYDNISEDVRAAVAQLQNTEIAPKTDEPELPLEAEPEDKPDRTRDEKGRFAKEPDAPEPAKPSSKIKPEGEAPAIEQPQAAQSAPPARLSKEAKAIWNSVPPSIQAEWAKMEADTAKGVEKLKSEHQQAIANWQQLEGVI